MGVAKGRPFAQRYLYSISAYQFRSDASPLSAVVQSQTPWIFLDFRFSWHNDLLRPSRLRCSPPSHGYGHGSVTAATATGPAPPILRKTP